MAVESPRVSPVARWELEIPTVPIARVTVTAAPVGYHVHLGELTLWVTSQAHWEDINEQIVQSFDSLPKQVTA